MRITKYLAVAAAALTSTSLAAAAPPGPIYSPSQLDRIVEPQPTISGWSFSRADSYIHPVPAHDPAFTLREWLLAGKPSKAQRALAAKLAQSGFRIGRHLVWDATGHAGNFVLFALLFRDAAGAKRTASTVLPSGGAHRISGLGSEAWGKSDPTSASLTWRRGNIVFTLAIDCNSSDCGYPPKQKARAYATQIDIRATMEQIA